MTWRERRRGQDWPRCLEELLLLELEELLEHELLRRKLEDNKTRQVSKKVRQHSGEQQLFTLSVPLGQNQQHVIYLMYLHPMYCS